MYVDKMFDFYSWNLSMFGKILSYRKPLIKEAFSQSKCETFHKIWLIKKSMKRLLFEAITPFIKEKQ